MPVNIKQTKKKILYIKSKADSFTEFMDKKNEDYIKQIKEINKFLFESDESKIGTIPEFNMWLYEQGTDNVINKKIDELVSKYKSAVVTYNKLLKNFNVDIENNEKEKENEFTDRALLEESLKLNMELLNEIYYMTESKKEDSGLYPPRPR